MHRAQWLILVAVLSYTLGCSDEHSLPAKFHEGRIETPEALTATYVEEDVVLEWTISAAANVLYYIVTVVEGTSGTERQYTAPGDQQTFTVEFAWTDSFYTFHLEAVDVTDFVGESSNVDTVFIPTSSDD
jgi:hypothetical protein